MRKLEHEREFILIKVSSLFIVLQNIKKNTDFCNLMGLLIVYLINNCKKFRKNNQHCVMFLLVFRHIEKYLLIKFTNIYK